MKVKTSVKAGGAFMNRCETVARPLAVKTGIKAGGVSLNRCETLRA